MSQDFQVRRFADARVRLAHAREQHEAAVRELHAAEHELETAGSALAERVQILGKPAAHQRSLFPGRAA